MKQLAVLSGKGGTGKTTVTAALGHLASMRGPIVMADADVDAANLELVLAPTRLETQEFVSGKLARVNADRCTGCGMCAEVCRFDAVRAEDGRYIVEGLACEGCASCFYQCPTGAIQLDDRLSGEWYRSQTRFGPLVHAHLYAGQENSGKLVTLVRQQAAMWATDVSAPIVLVDGPPGIGCPVIAACSGVNLVLLVTEPTVSGVHDLERILATTEHFRLPTVVLINKADLSARQAEAIRAFCAEHGINVVGEVPFDVAVTEAMVQGLPITDYSDGAVSAELRRAWENIRRELLGRGEH